MDVELLKRKGAAPPVLDALMRQVCAELELLSTVSAARIGSETSRLKSTGNAPTGERNTYLDDLRTRYMQSSNNWDRLQVIGDAQHALDLARANTGRTYKDGRKRRSKAWKSAVANDTRSSRLVAKDFGCSPGYVRHIRYKVRLAQGDGGVG